VLPSSRDDTVLYQQLQLRGHSGPVGRIIVRAVKDEIAHVKLL
jgi:hypothetical protein